MNRSLNVLCRNVRGINNQDKWNAIRNKIDESSCIVLCLKETKRESKKITETFFSIKQVS